jgi:hypothetical protein
MNIYEKLSNIQNELKAPKGQRNSFGNYNYRSCEDILEAVKPLCRENGCVLTLCDTIENVGERYYIKVVASLESIEKDDTKRGLIQTTAYARESLDKKGMDESQITGACSSYARKYALNGLFCIDDTKDADTDAYKKQEDKTKSYEDKKLEDKIEETKSKLVTPQRLELFNKQLIIDKINDGILIQALADYNFNSTSDIKTEEDMANVWTRINKIKKEVK